jgi:bleomycin hydrolase
MKNLTMKALISIIALLALLQNDVYPQEHKMESLLGSWMGRITTESFSLRAILRFEKTGEKIKAYLDSPDQGLKGFKMDKVWIAGDSLFVDATSLNAGIIYKGLILPGDSVIDGLWGGNMQLVLRPTDFVYTLKTNTGPEIEGYKIIKLIPTSPLKDQQATGVCWSFATTSFIETEALRLGKKPVVLSPMFFVVPTTIDKAEKYIRMNGKCSFGPGDLTFSVLSAYRRFGAIPQSIYPGKIDTSSGYDYGDMDKELLDKVKEYVASGRGKMTEEGYRNDIKTILYKTMGEIPENFVYDNKNYTPESFAREMVGINPDDYVEVTSYTHHPFYSRFILETEANWNNNYYLNLPINDFSQMLDYAIMHGYSVCWDGDAYRTGFKDSFAMLNDTIVNITQEQRQADFDNYTTVDVHNMHIVGIAENDQGRRFYIIKNSSDAMDCGGYMYMSKEYLLLKTISLMVNKNAIPPEIKTKVANIL